MLYSELADRTNGLCTCEEYAVINAAYMEAIGTPAEMDKDDAATLWHSLYGRKWEEKEEAHHNAVNLLIAGVANNDSDLLYQHYDETQAVIREVIDYFNRDIRPFTVKKTNRFTDKHNVEWSITRDEKRYSSEDFTLSIINKGKKVFVRHFTVNV